MSVAEKNRTVAFVMSPVQERTHVELWPLQTQLSGLLAQQEWYCFDYRYYLTNER
jgi:hypothetical protein